MNRIGLNLNPVADSEGGRFRTRPPVMGRAGEGPECGENLKSYLDALTIATAKATSRRPLRTAEVLAKKYVSPVKKSIEKFEDEISTNTDNSQKDSMSEMFNVHDVEELFHAEDTPAQIEGKVALDSTYLPELQPTSDQIDYELNVPETHEPIVRIQKDIDSSSRELSSHMSENTSASSVSKSTSYSESNEEYSQDFEESSSVMFLSDDNHSVSSHDSPKSARSVSVQTSRKIPVRSDDYFFLRNCIAVDQDYLTEMTLRDPNMMALNELMRGQLKTMRSVYGAQRNWYLTTLSALDDD